MQETVKSGAQSFFRNKIADEVEKEHILNALNSPKQPWQVAVTWDFAAHPATEN
jgi:hypothetical protein